MKDVLVPLAHLLTTIAKLLGPGGAWAVVADSLLIKQQLLAINRSRRRAPNLSARDRFLFGFWSLFLRPHQIQRTAVIIRPSTLLKFHHLLKQRKLSTAVFIWQQKKARPQGPIAATHPGYRRTEATQSTIRMPANRTTNQQSVRNRHL